MPSSVSFAVALNLLSDIKRVSEQSLLIGKFPGGCPTLMKRIYRIRTMSFVITFRTFNIWHSFSCMYCSYKCQTKAIIYTRQRICFYFCFYIFGEKGEKRYDISNSDLQMKYFIAFFRRLAPLSTWAKENAFQTYNNKKYK